MRGVVHACCVWWPGLLGQDLTCPVLPWLERGAGPAVVPVELWVLGLVLRGAGPILGIVPNEKESTSAPLAGVCEHWCVYLKMEFEATYFLIS